MAAADNGQLFLAWSGGNDGARAAPGKNRDYGTESLPQRALLEPERKISLQCVQRTDSRGRGGRLVTIADPALSRCRLRLQAWVVGLSAVRPCARDTTTAPTGPEAILELM